MPRIEIRVITDLHKDGHIIYRNVAYKHKFNYLKRKINESLGISPFRQILTLNLLGGDNRVIEGEKLNHKFSMYYSEDVGFLQITLTLIPERSRDNFLEISVFHMENDVGEKSEVGKVLVDKDDTVLTLEKKICALGVDDGFVSFYLHLGKKREDDFRENLIDNYMVSYYFEEVDVVHFDYPKTYDYDMDCSSTHSSDLMLDVTSDFDSEEEGIMLEEEVFDMD